MIQILGEEEEDEPEVPSLNVSPARSPVKEHVVDCVSSAIAEATKDVQPVVAPAAVASPSSTADATQLGGDSNDFSASQEERDNLVQLEGTSEELSKHAAHIEEIAMELDRAGDAEQACALYKQAADRYKAAAAACHEGNPDKAVLARRAGQILGRMVYLESLVGGHASLPAEEHILPGDHPAKQREKSMADADSAPAEGGFVARVKQTASAAAVGGTAGLLVLHGPIGAAVAAAGAAYATMRKDSVGEAARSMGDAGLVAAAKAQEFSEEHQVPEKVKDGLGKVREAADKYGVVDKAEAAASGAWKGIQTVDNNYDVSTKVATGLAAATKGAASATAKLAFWAARGK